MTELPTRTRINPHYKPLIEPYKEYVIKRWNEGCRNAQQIHRELKELDYTGSDQPIVRYFAQFRKKVEALMKLVDALVHHHEQVSLLISTLK